jgi:general secretion pathway protein M
MTKQQIRAWWDERPERDKTWMRVGMLVVGLALLWTIAIAPALRTLRAYEDTRAKLDVQTQAMLRLQAQAKALQAQPKLSRAASTQALQASVKQIFGNRADLSVSGGGATITLRGVSPQALAQWLASARTEARVAPVQAHLTQTGGAWSGTLQLALPVQ